MREYLCLFLNAAVYATLLILFTPYLLARKVFR